MLELRALGNAEIRTGKTTLTPSQEIVFASALYLMLQTGRKVSRTGLAELLWPEIELSTRSHRLRQTLLQLKKLGLTFKANRDTVSVDPKDVRADFSEVESIDARTLAEYDSLEFLPGYSPRFSEPFRDWVDTKRSELQSRCTRALLPILRDKRVKGDWAEVERIARTGLSIDPYNEAFVLATAEASAMRGQKSQAVAILDAYLSEVGSASSDLKLPATMLRKRISDALPVGSAQTHRDPDFLGREKEMEDLTACLRKAQRGHGGACLIHGEPGIGKTRLALELGKFARLQGVSFQRVSCRRSDVDRPLSVLVDLVPQLRELPGALGCSQETLIALKRLTEFDGTNTQPPLSFEELTNLYSSMRRALLDLLDAIAEEQCVLIVVDDVQWLDTASAKLFAELVEWSKVRRLLLLFTTRAASNALTDNATMEFRTIRLSPLTRAHSEELLRSIVNEARATDDSVFEWLLSVGEGNPFFLQELGKQWVETGHRHDVPPSITTVLDNRLSRISSEALHVLQTCSVLGEQATLERVEAMLEYKSHTLFAAVQELSLAGMLSPSINDAGYAEGRLQVRHDLISTAAIGGLAPISLAFLHRRAGSVLENAITEAQTPTPVLWAAAFHWANAGDSERALAVAQSCAEHLLEVGLPADAAAAFEKTYEYCSTDESRLVVLSRLVVALQMNCLWEKSMEVLKRCRNLRHRATPDANAHDELELQLFYASWRASLENNELLRNLLCCVASVDATPAHRVSCGLLALKIGTNLGMVDEMRRVYNHIEPHLTNNDVDPVTRFEVRIVFHAVCGNLESARRELANYLEVVRASKNPLIVGRGLRNASLVYRLAGRNEEAADLLSESLNHALTHRLVNFATSAALALARCHIAAGRLEQARAALKTAETLPQAVEDVQYHAERPYLSARLAFEEGNLDEALALHAVAAASVTPDHTANRRASVLALGIRIGIRAGTPYQSLERVVDELQAAHLINRGTGLQDFEAYSLFLGLGALGKGDAGQALLREYAYTYRREQSPLPTDISESIGSLGPQTLSDLSDSPCAVGT